MSRQVFGWMEEHKASRLRNDLCRAQRIILWLLCNYLKHNNPSGPQIVRCLVRVVKQSKKCTSSHCHASYCQALTVFVISTWSCFRIIVRLLKHPFRFVFVLFCLVRILFLFNITLLWTSPASPNSALILCGWVKGGHWKYVNTVILEVING